MPRFCGAHGRGGSVRPTPRLPRRTEAPEEQLGSGKGQKDESLGLTVEMALALESGSCGLKPTLS